MSLSLQVIIDEFIDSDKLEYSFPRTLSNFDRKVVHEIAEKKGLTSVSLGEGGNRYIMISKKKLEAKVKYPLTKSLLFYFFNVKSMDWMECKTSKNIEITEITVVTWNVLFDLFQKDLLYSDERRRVCLNHLKKCNAHVICLQEVTLSFLQECLGMDWIRQRYCISDVQGSTLDPYGLLILSRIPMDQLLYQKFAERTKPMLMAITKEWSIVNVHLPSDKNKDMSLQRKSMLEDAYFKSKYYPNCLLMGDFNFDKSVDLKGFKDVWEEIGQGDGYTFDPKMNPTAMITSSKGLSLRLDKILYKTSDWIPIRIELIGIDEFQVKEGTKLCPSDHYGLVCTLQKSVL